MHNIENVETLKFVHHWQKQAVQASYANSFTQQHLSNW